MGKLLSEMLEPEFVKLIRKALIKENWNFSAACRVVGISEFSARYRLRNSNPGNTLLTEYKQKIRSGERVRNGETPRVLWQDEDEYKAQQRHAARLALTKGRAGAWQVWARLALREVRQAESRAIELSRERENGTHDKSDAFLDALFALEMRFKCLVVGRIETETGELVDVGTARDSWFAARRKGEPWRER